MIDNFEIKNSGKIESIKINSFSDILMTVRLLGKEFSLLYIYKFKGCRYKSKIYNTDDFEKPKEAIRSLLQSFNKKSVISLIMN